MGSLSKRTIFSSVGLFLILFSLLLLVPFLKEAGILAPKPWEKGTTITYYNASNYDQSLKRAVQQWDKSGVPVKFKETNNIKTANLIIKDSERELKEKCNNPKSCVGWASHVGSPEGVPFVSNQTEIILMDTTKNKEKRMNLNATTIIIHELGHVLGLEHGGNDCSIMTKDQISCSEGNIVVFKRENNFYQLYHDCGPWESDIKRLEILYKTDLTVPSRCHDPKDAVKIKPLS